MQLLIALWLAGCLQIARGEPPPELAAGIDGIVQTYVKTHEFTGNVLVAQHGEVTFEKSYGIADQTNQVPVTADSRFVLASISKPFVATLILQLVEQGKLSLSDSIRKFLPETPKTWAAVTIEDLLDHTSGVYDYLNGPELDQIRFEHLTPRQLIDLFIKKPLKFKPGSQYSYSNLGYVILAFVVEQVSGERLADRLRENIFLPLTMTEAGVWGFNDDLLQPRAMGYVWQGGKFQLAEQMDPSIAFGDADVFTTARGLLAFDQALYGTTLLTDRTKQNMFTSRHGAYGLGFRIKLVNKHRLVYHDGHLMGNLHRFSRYIDDGLTIIILNNVDGGPVDEINDRIAALIFGEAFVPAPADH